MLDEPTQVVAHVVGQRLTGKFPDHRAELGIDVEAQTVVDRPDAPVGTEQAVAALAIGVVGHQIERADAREPVAVRRVLAQGEIVLREVRLHELLQRALAIWPVAAHGERHQPPAEGLGQVIGRELALEEAGREVPERALAALGLVDGQRAGTVERDLDQERRVGAARQPPFQRDVAAPEERRDVSGRRGHCSAGRRDRPDLSADCTSDRWRAPPSPASRRARRTPSPARA